MNSAKKPVKRKFHFKEIRSQKSLAMKINPHTLRRIQTLFFSTTPKLLLVSGKNNEKAPTLVVQTLQYSWAWLGRWKHLVSLLKRLFLTGRDNELRQLSSRGSNWKAACCWAVFGRWKYLALFFKGRAQVLCERRGGRPVLPSSLIVLMVSVDVKQHWTWISRALFQCVIETIKAPVLTAQRQSSEAV